jgi:hypothetical protein
MNEMESKSESSSLARTIGWVSVAAGMVALGFYVGRQLRARYNFNRRTPYDFYSHAGEDSRRASNNTEYGVGV